LKTLKGLLCALALISTPALASYPGQAGHWG